MKNKQMKAVYLRALGKKYEEITRELGWKRAQTFTAAELQVAKSMAEMLSFAEELKQTNPSYFRRLVNISKKEIDYDEYVKKKTDFTRRRLALKVCTRRPRRKPKSDEERDFLAKVGRQRWAAALKSGEVRKINPNTYEVKT